MSPPVGSGCPAAEWMQVVSSAWLGSRSGSNPASRAGQHRLARARRTDEQQMVPARGGDLEREPGGGLAPHVGKVGARRRRRQHHGLGRVRPRLPTDERVHQLLEAAHGTNHMSRDELGLHGAPGRHHDLGIGQRGDQWQRSGHRPHRAVEAQFTHEGAALARARRQLLARHQQAHGDGEIEAGSDLADARRRQVDRDPGVGPRQPAGHERGPDAVACLAARGVGKPDHGERRATPWRHGPRPERAGPRRRAGSPTRRKRARAGPPDESGSQGGRHTVGSLDPARPYDQSVLTPYPKGVTLTATSARWNESGSIGCKAIEGAAQWRDAATRGARR